MEVVEAKVAHNEWHSMSCGAAKQAQEALDTEVDTVYAATTALKEGE